MDPRVQKRGVPTQSSIARDLGLSQAAVSYALNGFGARIGGETYERVWKHALAIGYRAKGLFPAATPLTVVGQIGIVHGRGPICVRPDSFNMDVHGAIENQLAARDIATIPLGSSD